MTTTTQSLTWEIFQEDCKLKELKAKLNQQSMPDDVRLNLNFQLSQLEAKLNEISDKTIALPEQA